MEYMNVADTAKEWGISERRVRVLCVEGKIDGAKTVGHRYYIPVDSAKPIDGRIIRGKSNRKITDIISNKKYSISFEVFPPKTTSSFDSVKAATEKIAALKPSFMSVTYGAAGTTVGFTEAIAANLVKNAGIPAVAHLTCVNAHHDDVRTYLTKLRVDGIENILALRGDMPQGIEPAHDYEHASDLVNEIRRFGGFCIGCACYPEGHPESASQRKDLEYLKLKVDCGCDYLTTQMFFDNNIYYNFAFKAREAGIFVPIIPGIMPLTSEKQVKRIMSISGSSLPPSFLRIVDRFGNSPLSMKQAGIAFATEQIIDLFANGVTAVHVYSMNRPDIAAAICANLSDIIGGR